MGGICGKTSFGSEPVDRSLIEGMCRSIAYRGPDREGIYLRTYRDGKSEIQIGLGHRQIADIGPASAAYQALTNENDTIWVVDDGKIFNFCDLKNRLIEKGHRFKDKIDAEVIPHLYEEEGTRAVRTLDGMYAFALWDEPKRQLWLCRDRLGIKPLVYYWDGKHFVFASEIKALLRDPVVPRTIDYHALELYLAFNYIPAPHTIFKGIQKLEPGHFLIVRDGKLTVEKYWDLSPDHGRMEVQGTFSDQLRVFKDQLYRALNESIRKHLVADGPLGVFLSGGVDSSIIVALMSQHSDRPVQTFTIGFKDGDFYDETRYAREVARLYGTVHHEFKLGASDMFDVLTDVLSTFDEPFADSSAVLAYIASRETRRHVAVALSGDGSDELFAGYRSYLAAYWFRRYRMIPAILRTGLLEPIIKRVPDSRDIKALEYVRRLKKFIRGTKGTFTERVLALKEIFPEDIRREILVRRDPEGKDLPLRHLQRLLEYFGSQELSRILYTDVKDSLPADMLAKVDWMSMKNSLEVRVPFLDFQVVELAFQIPDALKIYKGKTKFILKETFKDLLPESVPYRNKTGFEIPISKWLKTDLKFLLEEYLEAGRIKRQGIFDSEVIRNLVRKHESGWTDNSWMLWNLIVFQYWFDQYCS